MHRGCSVLTGLHGGTHRCEASLHHGARQDEPCSLCGCTGHRWQLVEQSQPRSTSPHLQALWEAAWANPSCICYTWQQGPLPSCLCVKPEHLGGELKLGNSINRSSVLFSNDSLIWLSARYCAALPKWTVNLLIAGTTSLHPLSAVIDVTAPSHKLIVCCFVCSEQIACRCIINS